MSFVGKIQYKNEKQEFDRMEAEELIKAAMEAKEHAYAPHSHFRVGAALLTKSGKVYQGCHIENAGYSPTNCAERTAFFKAVYEGEREFAAIAINGDGDDYLYPCGVCRQVMAEFCEPDMFRIFVSKKNGEYLEYTLGELFPGAFTKDDIDKARVY